MKPPTVGSPRPSDAQEEPKMEVVLRRLPDGPTSRVYITPSVLVADIKLEAMRLLGLSQEPPEEFLIYKTVRLLDESKTAREAGIKELDVLLVGRPEDFGVRPRENNPHKL